MKEQTQAINRIIEKWAARNRDKVYAIQTAVASEKARQAVIDEAEARRAGMQIGEHAASQRVVSEWPLVAPQKPRGYIQPLYELLKLAHDRQEPCPKAAMVLKAWKANPPPGYGINVSDNLRTLTHCSGGAEPEKEVQSKSVQQAIDRLTGKRRRC